MEGEEKEEERECISKEEGKEEGNNFLSFKLLKSRIYHSYIRT